MNIPSRYASSYLGDIGVPPAGAGDFRAWTDEVVGETSDDELLALLETRPEAEALTMAPASSPA